MRYAVDVYKHWVTIAGLILCAGCACSTTRGVVPTTLASDPALSDPVYLDTVLATCVPPVGWRMDPLKSSPQHAHQVWVSPSGRTAYGVIYFKLPLPIGHEWTLAAFLQNMKKKEGEATLLGKQWDEKLPGIRFVAEGGLYRVRTNLQVRGKQGWAIYAGTLRKEAVDEGELAVAEAAREGTMVWEIKVP